MDEPSNSQPTSFILADEESFYHRFTQDLLEAKQEVIIESPFMGLSRLRSLKPTFELLIKRDVKVFVITKHPNEQSESLSGQSEAGIRYFEALGVQVLLCHNHHRKIAMIDRKVVWKGSLNILSQKNSREFMEREEDKEKCEALFKFLRYDRVSYIKKRLI
jgi:hypothetical protein